MSVHPARIVASLALLAGGFIVGVSVFAIVVAKVLVDAGMVIRPSDAALLRDLVPVLPFIGGFAVASLLGGIALLLERNAADALAIGTAVVGVTVGAIGTALVVVGRDPLAHAGSSPSDGIGILAVFTAIYATVIVAILAARTRSAGRSSQAVA
ncbi:MAG: hypothetical protein ACJ779_02635 [Chloroflexota bacterium]